MSHGLGAAPRIAALLLAWGLAVSLAAEPPPSAAPGGLANGTESRHAAEETSLHQALLSLPVAAALGAVLALRPQRRGTLPRSLAVAQSEGQIRVYLQGGFSF